MRLGKSTENCTNLGTVLYENVRSDKLSNIEKSDIFFNTKSTYSNVNNHCYMAE